MFGLLNLAGRAGTELGRLFRNQYGNEDIGRGAGAAVRAGIGKPSLGQALARSVPKPKPPAPAPKPKPRGGGGGGGGYRRRASSAYRVANQKPTSYTPPKPKPITPFSEVLPFDKIFNPSLINSLAMSQLQPDVDRMQAVSMGDLNRNLASTGRWRTGAADVERGRLKDAYSRQLKEQTSAFTGQVKDWLTDWHNRQSQTYYKTPSRYVAPKVPTFEEYMNQNPNLAEIYKNKINVTPVI